MRRARLLVLFLLISVPCWASNYSAWVISTFNPTLYWTQYEPSGTTFANSGSGGSGYNMTIVNTPSLNQSGANAQHGPAVTWAAVSSQYAHDNSNDTGTGPGDLSAGDRTIECWAKRPSGGVMRFGAVKGETVDNANRIWYLTEGTPGVAFVISDTSGNNYQSTSGGTVSDNTWVMYTATWTLSSTTTVLYFNGVQVGTTSSTSGTRNNGVQWFELGQFIASPAITYSTATSQDCLVIVSANSAAPILQRYNFGISGSGTNWPFTVKRPELPDFRDPGYLDKFVSRGYNTGRFSSNVLFPQYLTVGYLPFDKVANGRGN